MENIFYVSKANSIPFADRDISNYKTEENTLSFEGKQMLSKKATWYFQPNDAPTIQIKSNLSNIVAKIYKKDVFQEEIEAVLKIENLNQNITLDCEVISLKDSLNRGLVFEIVNIYDNSTDLNIIENYNFTGSLPDFTRTDKNIIGKTISIDSESYEILSILYDEVQESWCLEISTLDLTLGSNLMSLDYDIENFNIYEIPFDFEQYNNSDLYILLQANNEFETFYKVSELLKIGFFERQIEMQYKDNEDKDIFYSTGISHILRLPYEKITPYTLEENENQKNDNSVYLTDSQTNEGNEFTVGLISFRKYRQTVLALNHSELFIDGTGYVNDGGLQKEDNEDLNFVTASFQALKSNAYFKDFKKVNIKSNFIVNNGGFVTENENFITN